VPRGAPVHYTYSWMESEKGNRSEADAAGRPDHFDSSRRPATTTVQDTIRVLAEVDAADTSAFAQDGALPRRAASTIRLVAS